MTKVNYFQDERLARSYDGSRPALHQEALIAFHGNTMVPELYKRILDVGCGTGLSTLALSPWGREVLGVDSSEAMLKLAPQKENITYLQGSAESLPFPDSHFDLIFVASSFHWFERKKFFLEASRVLRPGKKILIYDSLVSSGLGPEFFRDYQERFPRPFSEVPILQAELQFFNLEFKGVHGFESRKEFDDEAIFRYFYNLSNVAAALMRGEEENKVQEDLRGLLKKYSVNTPYQFKMILTEIQKR